MVVLIVEIELFLPGALSLKDKRQTVKSVVERIRSHCHASVAEVGFQDLWQRSQIGIAIVAGERTVLENQINIICRILDDTAAIETVAFHTDYV
ncbi:MAG TPA: DUF503 domain-containing protein [Methylomusa anaerophila]|uniref:YlxP-like protein n=1 Tax=Methylomusa anaerophila TaxID=1930071 RepID=A0A348AJD3_9FIRM|nr:DUF503 domain-containing protein [Methylomusa anaerophila]BBB91181.1 hypothetical protein MAMMFC1_01852 [Methylomusa anaerophila]HML89058.1 DUF503 domain-containing protein [Methylomusa anaerophila]